MVCISLFAAVSQIKEATYWLSLGTSEREGIAISVVAMKKRLKIILDNGKTVLWNMSQERVDSVVSLFSV